MNSLKPINCKRLKTLTHNTQNGYIKITKERWIEMEIQKKTKIMMISPEGLQIIVKSKVISNVVYEYSFANLPSKFIPFYKYASDFVNVLRSKTPKIVLITSNGTFKLMDNEPYHNFECKFNDGCLINYTDGSQKLIIKINEEEIFLNPQNSREY